jgi:menaquinone-dependent protoporphyrinogen oxidase
MGSLHAGHYQSTLVRYARRCAAKLQTARAAFVSVSLSAAGDNPGDLKGLQDCLRRFQRRTGWRPCAVHHAAGAFSFTRYGFVKRFIMSRIASARGLKVDTHRDYDLTDYEALATFARGCVEGARRPAA